MHPLDARKQQMPPIRSFQRFRRWKFAKSRGAMSRASMIRARHFHESLSRAPEGSLSRKKRRAFGAWPARHYEIVTAPLRSVQNSAHACRMKLCIVHFSPSADNATALVPGRHLWKSHAIIRRQIWAAAVCSKFGVSASFSLSPSSSPVSSFNPVPPGAFSFFPSPIRRDTCVRSRSRQSSFHLRRLMS